jgi:hypothetical protein
MDRIFASLLPFCALVTASLMCSSAQATTLVGTRSTSTGAIVSDDGWSSAHGGFRVDFTVQSVGSLWQYDYVFKDADGSSLDPSISRFIKLEVSNTVSHATFQLISDGHTPGHSAGDLVTLTPADLTFHLWDAPATDPTFMLHSVFVGDDNDNQSDELSDGHITLLSSQGPMWGGFYARGANEGTGPAEATNRGLNGGVFPNPLGGTFSQVNGGLRPAFDPLQDPNAASRKDWILVPDTFSIQRTPEPSSLVLLGLGAAGLGGFAWRQRKLRARKP